MKTAEEYFLEKFGNKLTASESWVIRFAEDYAEYRLSESDSSFCNHTNIRKPVLAHYGTMWCMDCKTYIPDVNNENPEP